MGRLKKKGIIFKYKLAGSGSYEYLKKIAEENDVLEEIEFCGVLSHDQVFEWLDNIDFYIQPSKQEGLPRSMIEAVSRACPAAGSTAGGMGELVDNKYIFRKGNVDDIVCLLEKINSEDMKKQAKENFMTAQNYKKDVLDKKRYQFYSEFAEYCRNSKGR